MEESMDLLPDANEAAQEEARLEEQENRPDGAPGLIPAETPTAVADVQNAIANPTQGLTNAENLAGNNLINQHMNTLETGQGGDPRAVVIVESDGDEEESGDGGEGDGGRNANDAMERFTRAAERLANALEAEAKKETVKTGLRMKHVLFVVAIGGFAIAIVNTIYNIYITQTAKKVSEKRQNTITHKAENLTPNPIAAHLDAQGPLAPSIPPSIDALLEQIAARWASISEEEFWNLLGDAVAYYKLFPGEQYSVMQISKYWSRLSDIWQWNAGDFVAVVNGMITAYKQAGNSFPAIYRYAATARFKGGVIPRTVLFQCAQYAIASIWSDANPTR